jgi:hypothetical protein
VVKDIFERLNKRQPQQAKKKTTERQLKNSKLVAQGEQEASIQTFLRDILAKRPAPATAIEKRGAEQKFTRKQLWRAKRLMGIISFRKGYGFEGRWYWCFPQDTPITTNPKSRFTRRLRNLARARGYRLQPIGKPGAGRPRGARNPSNPS